MESPITKLLTGAFIFIVSFAFLSNQVETDVFFDNEICGKISISNLNKYVDHCCIVLADESSGHMYWWKFEPCLQFDSFPNVCSWPGGGVVMFDVTFSSCKFINIQYFF